MSTGSGDWGVVRGKAFLRGALKHAAVRYALAAVLVTTAFALRKLLEPLTGTGAPFVLFFAAVVATTLWAGPGPGVVATLLSTPLAAYVFAMRAGYTPPHAAFQAALFVADGLIVVYLSYLVISARRAAERSEARTRELIDLAPVAFFLADLEGRFTDVNLAACRMLGYEREELIGKTILDVIPAEDAPRLAATKAALLVPGHVHSAEWTHRRKDGTRVTVEINANILQDGRWQAFARDVSERKRVADERQVFVSLLENSSDFIGIADPDGTPVYVNPAGRRMVALPADRPVEQTRIQDYYPTEERAFADEVIVKSMLERGRWSGETYLRNWQTGESIPVSDENFMIRDPSGARILGMGTIMRDVTERKRVEQEKRFLADAGQVLAASLDHEQTIAALGRLIVRDFADWCIVDLEESANHPARLRVFSADPQKATLGEQLEELQRDRRPFLVGPGVEAGQPFVIGQITPADLESLAPSAAYLRLLQAIDPRSMMGVPLQIHGHRLGVLFLVSSTPSRVYGLGDLRLAATLADRTALAIENGRLYQKAVHATRLRDEVLAIVAHDLRNPLSVILMQAEMLARRVPEPERGNRKPKDAIIRAANRMQLLIRDLLDITTLEAGQLSIEPARVSARQLLVDSVEAEGPLATSGALELQLELASDLPDVWGDQHRLLQVLENLVGNAIKFTPQGGRITIGAAPREHEVLFWVADTGRGISREGLPHVFDRFWQATKGSRLGAGLGLPITRGIVEAHGGRIWVESTLGKGSIFFFTVPEAPTAAARLSESSPPL